MSGKSGGLRFSSRRRALHELTERVVLYVGMVGDLVNGFCQVGQLRGTA